MDSTAGTTIASSVHPLQYTWTWWYSISTEVWEPKPIKTFHTIREFWELYNNILSPSSLPPGCDYFIFRDGIPPEWNDARNCDGGQISFEFNNDNADLEKIDECWLWGILALIGEFFENMDLVNGLVICSRPRFVRLSLWIGDISDENVTKKIVEQLESNLRLSIVPSIKPFKKPEPVNKE